jgi:hypothetical protein
LVNNAVPCFGALGQFIYGAAHDSDALIHRTADRARQKRITTRCNSVRGFSRLVWLHGHLPPLPSD